MVAPEHKACLTGHGETPDDDAKSSARPTVRHRPMTHGAPQDSCLLSVHGQNGPFGTTTRAVWQCKTAHIRTPNGPFLRPTQHPCTNRLAPSGLAQQQIQQADCDIARNQASRPQRRQPCTPHPRGKPAGKVAAAGCRRWHRHATTTIKTHCPRTPSGRQQAPTAIQPPAVIAAN